MLVQVFFWISIGVADKEEDKNRIAMLDSIPTYEIGGKYIVGIERECSLLSFNMERYLNNLIGKIKASDLTEPLKTQVLTQIDTVQYKNLSVIRIKVPPQTEPSYVGEKLYTRKDSSTIELTLAKEIAAVLKLFT